MEENYGKTTTGKRTASTVVAAGDEKVEEDKQRTKDTCFIRTAALSRYARSQPASRGSLS